MQNLPADLAHALLRRFEPILHFTSGERFFPMDVGPYVEASSLWMKEPKKDASLLVPENRLTLQQLGRPRPGREGTVHYLKFIEPLDLRAMAAHAFGDETWLVHKGEFRPDRARLARVGYLSRLADAGYSLTLLARGRVRGDTATAAAMRYASMMAANRRYCYHGRAVQQNSWTVLQYWFFYAFNNWRTGFSGANDHEADWEMISIYLSKTDTAPGESASETPDDLATRVAHYSPEWVAYASHDYSGDDLRRRWIDPEVRKVGDHPIIYVGAGSHASYFSPGEYLTEIELPLVSPLVRTVDGTRRFFSQTLNLYTGEDGSQSGGTSSSLFRIPFIDYARGDGFTLGPGQTYEWDDPVIITPPPPWVNEYRGLWGLFASDPFNGENAPSGPKYNRDGSVRRAWFDPVGWAGLDKVMPAPQALQTIDLQITDLDGRRRELSHKVDEISRELAGLGAQVEAMRNLPYLDDIRRVQEERITEVSADLEEIRNEITVNEGVLEALEAHAGQLRKGQSGPLRDHIKRAHEPVEEESVGRITEVWAAISVTVMLVLLVLVIIFARRFLFETLAVLFGLFLLLEATFRGRLPQFITGVAITLAIVAAGVLAFEFFFYLIGLIILMIAFYVLYENLRDLVH
jgi:hypothetical protein